MPMFNPLRGGGEAPDLVVDEDEMIEEPPVVMVLLGRPCSARQKISMGKKAPPAGAGHSVISYQEKTKSIDNMGNDRQGRVELHVRCVAHVGICWTHF